MTSVTCNIVLDGGDWVVWQMLLAEVAVGLWAKGAQGMRSCPVLPGEKYRRYNSLVNDVTAPSIFVVQHTSQAYPAYLITYH